MKILIVLTLVFLIFPTYSFAQTDELPEELLSELQLANREFSYAYTDDIAQSFNQLGAIAEEKGEVRIIVGLAVPLELEGEMAVSEIQDQTAMIQGLQNSLLKELSAVGAVDKTTHSFKHVPFIVTTVNLEALSVLQDSLMVASITQDVAEPPLLKDSTVIIEADKVWNPTMTGGPFTGAGWKIAVLDTGVDKNHSFLSGKVASEACYSSTIPADNSQSLCPGGVAESILPNSGMPCVGIRGCDHGTHVAGIVAGDTFRWLGFDYRGVAPGAEIIAIKVFSEFNNPNSCFFSPPCILSYRSDQMKGLDRVIDLHLSGMDVASVNLSLGGGNFNSPCDNDPRKFLIDQLRSFEIATVIASGNDGSSTGISIPACISSAISVGSTTKSNAVSTFSNSHAMLDLLAPGQNIASSIPNDQFAVKSGTSMATPHVAGAWALMKEKAVVTPPSPPQSLDFQLDLLKNFGIMITDPRNNLDKPLIQLEQVVLDIPEFPIAFLVFAAAFIPIFMLLRRQEIFRKLSYQS